MFRGWKRILLLALVFALSACAQPAAPTPTTAPPAPTPTPPTAPAPTPTPEAKPVTLRVMIVDYVKDKTDKWLENEVVPAFKQKFPHVNVEFIYVNWGTLDETVQGYFAAGEGADILNLGSEYIAEYGDRLAPLNKYLGPEAWPDINQFVPATLETVTWNGEIRGLPWLVAPRAYMCRTDLLKEAGIERAPRTFQEAIEQARKTTIIEQGALKRAGIVTTGKLDDWQEYIALIWALGGELYKPNGEPAFDSPQARAALKFMYDRRRAVYPDETVADLPPATGSRLADGTAVCIWGNLWGAPDVKDPIWEQIEFVPGLTDPQNFPNSKPVVQVFTDWLAVAGYSKNVEIAAEFLKFLGSAENLNRYNRDFGSFPPRKDAWTGYVQEARPMTIMADLMAQYGRGFSDVRETAKFREILQKQMSAYFTDQQDLDTTLRNIQEQYTQVLREAGRLR
ncbi:MAG TPA: extracellular solute-binding protein [Thermoflexus sp.]|nr:extracellular solute-binding protein [Thermoflexus sp.]